MRARAVARSACSSLVAIVLALAAPTGAWALSAPPRIFGFDDIAPTSGAQIYPGQGLGFEACTFVDPASGAHSGDQVLFLFFTGSSCQGRVTFASPQAF